MRSIIIPLLLILHFNNTTPLFFTLEPHEQKCISQEQSENKTLSVVYFVNGEFEKRSSAYITDPSNKKIWTESSKKTGRHSFKTETSGLYSLCLENTSNSGAQTITFEFVTDYDESSKLVTVQSIEELNIAIDDVYKKLDTVNFNIKNSVVRKFNHGGITNYIHKSITIYTVMKIWFVILFSISQILMITSIFKNVKIVDKIKISEMQRMNKNESRDNDKETTEFL